MGRYSQQQLREVLKLDSSNEYVLFCPLYGDRSLILPEIRNASNVIIAADPLVVDPLHLNNKKCLLAYAERFQSWIAKHNIDVFHATAPFVLSTCEADLPIFNVCPLVVTFYDLIPLLYPERYLSPDPLAKTLYLRQLQFVSRANRFIAISQSARLDAVRYLGFPEESIDIAYPIADPCFRVLSTNEAERALNKLRSRFRIPEEYVLSVSHMHFAKNLETLLRGYSLLPYSLRKIMPLVVAFALSGQDKESIADLARQFGIVENLIITNHITEEELVALYNRATLVVHASRYEGFGLPVLEAMSCGTPVITTTASSLPEVGGEAAVYVDPEDSQAFADAMEALCSDPDRRSTMQQQGLEQAKAFSGMQLARNTLASYEKARSTETGGINHAKPRVAIWSPLPPVGNGVASYSVDLAEQMLDQHEIEIFVDDGYLPSLQLLNKFSIQHHSAFQRRQASAPFDAIIYQLGASKEHFYMYPALLQWPGIPVLHDLAIDRALYEEFPDKHHILKPVLENSKAVLVHSEFARKELEAIFHSGRIKAIPYGVADCYRHQTSKANEDARSRLGFDPKAFILGVFGIISPSKRIESVLSAFSTLRSFCPNAHLVVIGPVYDGVFARRLRTLIRNLKLESGVCFANPASIGDESEQFSAQCMSACDAVIGLQSPAECHASRSLWQAMAAGKPLIISDLSDWSGLPDSVCLRVPTNGQEVESLVGHLRRLSADVELRRRMAVHARAYYEEEGTAQMMARSYRAVIKEVAAIHEAPTPPTRRSIQPLREVCHSKVSEIQDFDDPELAQLVGDIFRHELGPIENVIPSKARVSRYWQSAMSARAMRRLGLIHPDAVILGVCAEGEALPAYLAQFVHHVQIAEICRDLRGRKLKVGRPDHQSALPGIAADCADHAVTIGHQIYDRLLGYPDCEFDAIFALDVLGECENLDLVANATYEMGRVLKPGGLLTLTVRYCMAAPPGKRNLPKTLLFSLDSIQRYIIEASGLSAVNDPQIGLSSKTLNSSRDLISIAELDCAHELQDLITVRNGIAFCAIHVALRKTDQYPLSDNQWATLRPTPDGSGLALNPEFHEKKAVIVIHKFSRYPVVEDAPGTQSWPKKVLARTADWARPIVFAIYGWTLSHVPKPFAKAIRWTVRRLKKSLRLFQSRETGNQL
jgi:glycosyltransferase involved in cell wall biosynthesis/SAM-dependent methyltransferase